MASKIDIADLNPEFSRRLNAFLSAAAAQGIPAHIISGYRANDLQTKLYANYQAKLAGKPLPYPEEGSGGVAAPPGGSFHNYGLAADILANDPSQQSKLIALGQNPQYGLHPLGSFDPPHFQMPGNLADLRANQPTLQGQPVNLNAYARGGQTEAPISDAQHATAAAPGQQAGPASGQPVGVNPFLNSLAQIESNNRNIFSTVDRDVAGPGTRSQGYYQINTPTWQQFAPKAGVDLSQYPNAMRAPQDVQAQVASQIPLARFGPRTRRMLGQQFGQLDTSKTVGQLSSQFTNAAPMAPGAIDPEITARGKAMTPPIIATPPPLPGAPGAPVTPGTTLTSAPAAAAPAGPLGQVGALAKDKDFLANVNKLTGQDAVKDQGGGGPRESSFIPGPPARNVMPGLGGAPGMGFVRPQGYGLGIDSMQNLDQPLQWGAGPPGLIPYAGAGQQGPPGTSLASLNQLQALFAGMGQNPFGGYSYA